MPTFNSELRASPSISNPSCEFDQRSKTSQTSQLTDQTLITPLVNSTFGNDPQVKPVPSRFPDLVHLDGLTDEQWEREVEIGEFKDLDETFFRDDIWYTSDLYDHDDAVDVPPRGLHRDSVLETIKEVDEVRELDSLFNVTFPSPPLIRPVNVVWDRTPKYISQLLMSPIVLNNPAICHSSFGNINPIHSSPIVISPFLFSSCRPSPHNSGNGDVTRQEIGLGLGLVGVPKSMTQYESRKSHTISEQSPLVDTLDNSRDHKPLYDALSFGPALSPLDKMLEGLGQRAVPYVPTTLGSTIYHTGPTSNVVYTAMNTVTAGCSHPAASTSFVVPAMEASRARKQMKGLGLGLPMGLKRRLCRCSSGIPTSEACQDLASLASAPETANSLSRGFRGRMLSPILEVDDPPQLDPCPKETGPLPAPTRQRNVFKRTLKFLF